MTIIIASIFQFANIKRRIFPIVLISCIDRIKLLIRKCTDLKNYSSWGLYRDDLWLRQVTSFDTVGLMTYGQLWMSIGEKHPCYGESPYVTMPVTFSLASTYHFWKRHPSKIDVSNDDTNSSYNTIHSLQFYSISTILLFKYFKRYNRVT